MFVKRAILMTAVILTTFASASARPAAGKGDSAYKFVPNVELDYTKRQASSSSPVSIEIRGQKLFVQSKTDQLLPVYRKTGAFYCAFKLNKGTNILSGLPKGIYLINKQKIVLS